LSLAQEEKAQSSFEYLLLVGGAILITVLVALFLKTMASNLGSGAKDTLN